MTIICIEGPNKAGKTTLIEEVMSRLEPEWSNKQHFVGADGADGLGYTRPFIRNLDTITISVWDRAWIGEYIYGTLLDQPRQFVSDPWLAEWFYSRALQGRGGRFVLLPEDKTELEARRDETDGEINPVDEYYLFRDYALSWGYEILENGYDEDSLMANATAGMKSAFTNLHNRKVKSTQYIGPLNPKWTFVGETRQEFAFDNRPFYGTVSAEYFRPFKKLPLSQFGFATIDGFLETKEVAPDLFRRIITVGNRAGHELPGYPNAPYIQGDSSEANVKAFAHGVIAASKVYRA